MGRRNVLFTIGYERRSLSSLVRKLTEHGVERLIDVRLSPSSRRRGMSLMALFEGLRRGGITYEHAPGLGNPPAIRALFHRGQLDDGKKEYRSLLVNGHRTHIDRLIAMARLQPTAILCVEDDVARCHRGVIAEVVSRRANPPIQIVHL